MKRIIIALLLVASIISLADTASAQGISISSKGLSYNNDGNRESISVCTLVRRDKQKDAWVLGSASMIPFFELGWNVMSTPDYSIYNGSDGNFFDLNSWKSTQVTVNLLNASFRSRSRKVGVDMALGIRANNYRLNGDISFTRVDGLVTPFEIEGNTKKSKFNVASLHIPVEFWVGKTNKVAFSIGGFVDMTMNSHTKIKFKGGKKHKEHNYPVNFIQAGVTARIKIKGISIYGSYTPTSLFKTGRGPEMQQWSFGIGIW